MNLFPSWFWARSMKCLGTGRDRRKKKREFLKKLFYYIACVRRHPPQRVTWALSNYICFLCVRFNGKDQQCILSSRLFSQFVCQWFILIYFVCLKWFRICFKMRNFSLISYTNFIVVVCLLKTNTNRDLHFATK